MSNKPNFEIFHVTESEKIDSTTMKPKSFWNKVGAAWKNKDGSINCQLSSLPLDGKFQLRIPKEATSPQA